MGKVDSEVGVFCLRSVESYEMQEVSRTSIVLPQSECCPRVDPVAYLTCGDSISLFGGLQ